MRHGRMNGWMDGRTDRAERSRRLFNEMDEDNDGLLVRGSGSGSGSTLESGTPASSLTPEGSAFVQFVGVWFCVRFVVC
eukprot:COSAG06_NODE_2167_length_7426_cov_7.331787_6_plen_79_part_00